MATVEKSLGLADIQADTEVVKALWDGGQNFPWPKENPKPAAPPAVKKAVAPGGGKVRVFEPVACP